MPLKCFGKIPRLLLLLHLSCEISIVVSIKVCLSVGQKGRVISIGQITLGSDLLFVSQAIDHPCEQHDATSLNQMLRKQQRKRSPRRQFL